MAAAERPVIFGEVLFDCFPDGQAVLGGAPFNVAWHLQGFGLHPLFVSRVGDDPLGHRVRERMHGHGMDTSGLQLDSAHPTGRVDISFTADGHAFEIPADQAWDHVAADALPPLPREAFFYHGSLAARGPVSAGTLALLGERLPGRRLVDVNLREPWWRRERVLELLAGAFLVKLNDEELRLLVPGAGDDAARVRRLLDSARLDCAVITRGAAGAELWTAAGERHAVRPANDVEPVDTVGAGDAFTSVLVLGLLRGWPYPLLLERAQAFASATLAMRGATPDDPGFYRPLVEAWGAA